MSSMIAAAIWLFLLTMLGGVGLKRMNPLILVIVAVVLAITCVAQMGSTYTPIAEWLLPMLNPDDQARVGNIVVVAIALPGFWLGCWLGGFRPDATMRRLERKQQGL